MKLFDKILPVCFVVLVLYLLLFCCVAISVKFYAEFIK